MNVEREAEKEKPQIGKYAISALREPAAQSMSGYGAESPGRANRDVVFAVKADPRQS